MDQDRESAFAAYASSRWLTLARSAVLLGASHHEAEDLAQAVLMKCYVSWSRVSAAAHPDAYVMKILVNEFRSSRRRRWWQERPTASLPEVGAPDATDRVDGADAVARALDGLATGQREAVVLRYYAHLTDRQIADALGVAEGTVKSRLSRAHRRLASDEHLASLRDGTTR
ncbi:MAG TPA: SigE family RNA polymerase sigma factor [Nocardioides sp.]|nr:SigE family RNA polymerase sigma factor [Nocardioides sp.]